MSPSHRQRADVQSDEMLLHRLGYRQVLHREMGTYSNFAISFTIISALAAGCVASYHIAFNNGGPVAVIWGWLLVGAFTIVVAMAMAEIASAMPTAGALYFWASKLGGPAWGWFTGWFNLIGQISVTAAIDYGGAVFITALLNLLFPDTFSTATPVIFAVFTVIVALHVVLNLLNVNVLSLINAVGAGWHMFGVAMVVAILTVVPRRHQSATFVFTETLNNSGFSGNGFGFWYVFGIGLLMSAYTITGFDASAHVSEETRNASRSVAVGMVLAVVLSVFFGFILLLAITFAIPNVQGTLDAGPNAIVYSWTTALNGAWAPFLLIIIVVAQFFCGAASLMSASRMMFAFSRDRAVPGSSLWRRVARNRSPVYAVTAIGVLAWLIMVPSLFSVVAYLVATSIAVIGLSIAFALPIFLRIRAGSTFEPGEWSLGRHYRWISPLAVAWIALICVIGIMPVSPHGVPGADDFDWELVNYTPLTVGGAFILFGGWYLVSARSWFTGPVREVVDAAGAGNPDRRPSAPAHQVLSSPSSVELGRAYPDWS